MNCLPCRKVQAALVGRLILLVLVKSFFGKEDSALTEKLATELSGILNWALVGYRRLNKRGHFIQPKSSDNIIDTLETLAAPVKAFIRDRCEVGPGKTVSVDELFSAWRKWCNNEGVKETGSKEWFGRNLHAAIPELIKTRPRHGEKQVRMYQGIGLLSEPF
jgi:putative DNA primase/helicase